MTDWEKLRVADLKEELKNRGIPLTGLKLKQQFIDKLNELDSEVNTGDTPGLDGDAEERSDGNDDKNAIVHAEEDDEMANGSKEAKPSAVASAVGSHDESEDAQIPLSKDTTMLDTSENEAPQVSDAEGDLVEQSEKDERFEKDEEPEKVEQPEKDEQISPVPSNELTGEERVKRLPGDLPAELKKEESDALDSLTPEPIEAKTATEEKMINEDDVFVPQASARTEDRNEMAIDESEASEHESTAKHPVQAVSQGTDTDEQVNGTADQVDSTPVHTPDLMDDQRKRKRRSITPTPGSEDIAQKKLKLDNGSVSPARRGPDALKKIQEATDAAQATRDLDISGDRSYLNSNNKEERQDVDMEDANAIQDENEGKDRSGRMSPKHHDQQPVRGSPSQSSQGRDISPARHPATQSLYIRNFKRPLNIPTLRSHISSLAGSSANSSLKVFYLDSTRTHALISLTSISAASRVRNAMHGTKFPDEPMREPLWIDFVPDEKVQGWIDQETGTNSNGLGGGRASSKKYEVIYEDHGHTVEAILRETSSSNNQPHRQGIQPSHPSRIIPQDSTATTAAGPGIHPSRAPLIPQIPQAPRSQQQARAPTRPSDPGKGFQALDELFSSTTSKPKIYYKLPAQSVIDDRLDLMRDLRVTHEQMGQTGDEGMKRYSFEKDDRSRQEVWVDKGPEFGFGRRGQERLTGYGNTYGGARGRGGFRGARRGDTWRGR